MNCDDMDQTLIGASASALPPNAQEHLKRCERCQELVRALSISFPADLPSPAILGHINETLVSDLRPVRPVAPARYLFILFVVIFVAIAANGVYRMGAFAIGAMSPMQAGVILSALAVSSGLLAYSLVCQMVPGSRHRIPPRLLPIGILFSLIVAIAVLFQFQHERNFWANGWSCLRVGIPIGILAAVPFWLILRRGAILSPGLTGTATGLLAGLVGTSVLEIHCPNLDASHILVSHLGVAVLCAIAGLAVGLGAEAARVRSVGRSLLSGEERRM
jgi:hypothetical protein